MREIILAGSIVARAQSLSELRSFAMLEILVYPL